MSLNVSPVKFFSFNGKSNAATVQKENRQPEYDKNPVSGKGETMNLIKATFLAGAALGGRLLWEIFDGDFVFETAGNTAKNLVDKNKKNVSSNKRILLYIGATAAVLAAAVSGFALLYTMLNAPKIAYNSKINTFKKSKEMDVYIKANEAEKSIYTQMNEKAKNADEKERDKLKEQYQQMKIAKNQVPDFIKLN